jgi:hypothetical protein
MFLKNSYSFLLVRPAIPKPVIEPRIITPSGRAIRGQTEIQKESEIILPPSYFQPNSGRKFFLPNSYSFLLPRAIIVKPVIQPRIITPSGGAIRGQSGTEESAASLPSSPKPIIGDKNKRAFLKMAGVAVASIAGALLLPKKADALIMGSSPTTGVVGVKNSTNARINPATEETAATLLKTTDLTFDAGSLNVKVTSQPAGGSSYSDSGNVDKKGLVDADRHVQVDVLTSALPTSASTETTLQTISFGGYKFTLRLATVGDIDYVGEAAIGTLTSAASWRIKRIDSSSGTIIQWAGTGVFDQIWDNRASLSYS